MGKLLKKAENVKSKGIFEDIWNLAEEIPNMSEEEQKVRIQECLDRLKEIRIMLDKEQELKKQFDGNPWDFSKEKALELFAEDRILTLVPIKEEHKDNYLKVKTENSSEPDLYESEDYINVDWTALNNINGFVCSIFHKETKEFIGYISIKNTRKNLWEIALELLKEHCYKGYGKHAITLFLPKISEITGKNQYQALVESDNVPCQKMMDKLGARLIDIYNFVSFTDEEAEAFENDNLDKITDRMVMLAEQIDVEPKQLLSHVLDYRIFVEEGMIVDRSRKETI